MKTKLLISFFVIGLLFLTAGCKDDDDVKFDVSIPVTFTVDETTTSSIGKFFSIQATLNALDNAQVAKFKDRIKNVYINSMRYTITDVNPSGTINLSRINLLLKGSIDFIASEVDSQVLAAKSETELGAYNDYEFSKLSDQIKFNQQAIFNVEMSTSKTPVKFTLTVTVNMTIVAKS